LSLEENKATIRRYTKACNERNVTLLKEMISPDYFHSALQLRSWKEYIEFEKILWKAFPDLRARKVKMTALLLMIVLIVTASTTIVSAEEKK
jgi:hypothetical protein